MTARPTVLVVDDDRDIRESLCEVLEQEGYRVVSAGNGLEALGYLESARELPALILLDLMMPVMNGFQFRIAQKKNLAWSGIPVIVVTATSRAETVSTMDMEGVGFLRKPIELRTLLALIEGTYGLKPTPI